MPIPYHELLARVEFLEARLERVESLEISPSDLEEHLARLKRLEGFMECIEGYLDRLERLSGPLSRLEERLDLMEGRPTSRKTAQRPHPGRLVQSRIGIKAFLSQSQSGQLPGPQRGFPFKAFRAWLLQKLGRS